MNEKGKSDAKVAIEAKRGRRKAIGELYSRYYHLAYFSAYQITGRPEEAEDAASDVFAALIVNPDLLDERRDIKAYIFQAAKNNAMHFVDWKRKDHEELNEEIVSSEQEKKYSISNRTLSFLKSILTDSEVSVYLLHTAYSYSFKEIGESLGLSEDASSSLYFRAKNKIKIAPKPTDFED